MEQPEGLQQELLKMNREARTWVLDIVNQIANARAAHEDLENGTIVRVADLEQQLHAAGDGDTWREACKRGEAERRFQRAINHHSLVAAKRSA